MRVAALLGLVAAALCGCASQQLSIRSLPPDTPAADQAAAAAGAAALAAAFDLDSAHSAAETPAVTPADAPSMLSYDPWERVNRMTYRFNARADEAVMLPVANAYRRVPEFVRAGVHNVFANLAEIDSVVNYVLQVRLGPGARSLGRLVINSTVGIAGLFDVAKTWGLAPAPTGLSATLSTWGMHPGPYLVVPFLGPSTLRDGVGLVGDYGVSHVVNVAQLYRGNEAWALGTATVIDERANSTFRYYATGSPFEYERIRFLYVRKRLLEDEGLHRTGTPVKRDADKPAGQ
jgi:phospholipid-binding lipoprotein MlaA